MYTHVETELKSERVKLGILDHTRGGREIRSIDGHEVNYEVA